MDQQYRNLRVGLLGLGLKAYWPQFEGLKERLQQYLSDLEARISGENRSIVQLGLVDSVETAVEAGHRCRTQDIDILLVYPTTYSLSSIALPVIVRAGVPVLLLNLQPSAAIEYDEFNRLGDRAKMTAEWLAFCSSCPIPELTNVLTRLRISFHQVTGLLHGDLHVQQEFDEWIAAATAAKRLRHSKLGLLGQYYTGMLDICTDLTQVAGTFGLHIEHVEVDELSARRAAVTDAEVAEKVRDLRMVFDCDADCLDEDLAAAGRTAVALQRLVSDHNLDMLAYYYRGIAETSNQASITSIIVGTSMLTASGIPVAGEYEVKNVIAMKIMDSIAGGGSFTEFYGMDYADDIILMGHDGPGHLSLAEHKIKIRLLSTYHGKAGSGLSVEMAVRHGPVTLLSVVEHPRTGFMLLVAEGESIGGPILEIGNTNSRYRFSLGARGFVEAWNASGPAHHCAVSVGHHARTLKKMASILGLEYCRVC